MNHLNNESIIHNAYTKLRNKKTKKLLYMQKNVTTILILIRKSFFINKRFYINLSGLRLSVRCRKNTRKKQFR